MFSINQIRLFVDFRIVCFQDNKISLPDLEPTKVSVNKKKLL